MNESYIHTSEILIRSSPFSYVDQGLLWFKLFPIINRSNRKYNSKYLEKEYLEINGVLHLEQRRMSQSHAE